MPQNTANYDASLKRHYGPTICEVLNNMVKLLKYLEKSERKFDGVGYYFPAHVGRNHSARYQNAGDDLAAAGNQGQVLSEILVKDMFGHIRLTEKVILQSKTNRGAFAKASSFEIEGMVKDMLIQANRSAWGDGSGIVASVDSEAAGVVTLKNLSDSGTPTDINTHCGNRYIRVGDILDFYTAAGVARLQGAEVTAKSVANDTVTISGGTGAAPQSGDLVYLAQPSLGSPTGVDAMGAQGIVDDNTFLTSLQTISRSTYPIWKSQVINVGTNPSTPGTLTVKHLQRMEDMLTDSGYGQDYTIWCHASVRTAYLDLLTPDRRYQQPLQYDPGFKEDKSETGLSSGVNFNGHPVIAERDAPWQTMFFLNKEVLKKFVLEEPHWVEDDGGGVLRLVPGKAAFYEGQVAWYYNIGVESMGPNSLGALRYINATPDRVELN